MTGALGILEPGTPIQVGLAVLVMFVYLMVLLRFTPYKSNADDMLAYISTSATLFIAMIGLFLKLDENSEADRKHFDPHIMGNILVGITIAEHCVPKKLEKNSLLIEVDHPGWSTEIRYLESDLLKRLRQRIPKLEVSEIKVRVKSK